MRPARPTARPAGPTDNNTASVPPEKSMPRPSLLFVTRSAFWRPGNGDAMRTVALVRELAAVADLTVFYPGPMDEAAMRDARALGAPFRIACGDTDRPDPRRVSDAVRALCRRFSPRAVILSRLRFDFLRDAIPRGPRLVMDTHDLMSDRSASLQREGWRVQKPFGFEEEVARLARYDLVLLIQPDDHARVAARLGERAMCVSHPVVLPVQPVRPASRVLGFAASRWVANVHALDWMLRRVWPRLAGQEVFLDVAGYVTRELPAQLPPGVRSRGFVPDLEQLWSGVDVAVNPVRWGSGLKIKNVEALASGLPLVTTTEGARGIADAAGDAFLLADEPDAFAAACLRLLDDLPLRARVASSALGLARRRFSPSACFGPLRDWIAAL